MSPLPAIRRRRRGAGRRRAGRGVTLRLRVGAVCAALTMTTAWALLTVDNVVISQGVDKALHPLGLSLQNAAAGEPAAGPGVPRSRPLPPDSSIRAAEQNTRRYLEQRAIGAAAASAVAAWLLGWLLAGRALRPLRRLACSAAGVSAQDLSARLPVPAADDELRELTTVINDLLRRLQDAFEAERRFAANASHELRTPLALLRASAELPLTDPSSTPDARSLAKAALSHTHRADRIIEALLVLARSQAGIADSTRIALHEVTETSLGQVRAAISRGALPDYGLRISARISAAWVDGSGDLIEQLAGNLLRNAVQYNRAGGTVSVGLSADPPSGKAVLTVANDGAMLTKEDVAHLAEPFQRGSGSPSPNGARHIGAGLGLTIASSIAAAHSGSLDAQARAEGGLAVSVVLPLASPDPPRRTRRPPAAPAPAPTRPTA